MTVTSSQTALAWSSVVDGDFEAYKSVNDGIVADVEVGSVMKEVDTRSEERREIDSKREEILRLQREEQGGGEEEEKGQKKRDIVHVPVRVVSALTGRAIQKPVKGSSGETLGDVIRAFLGAEDSGKVERVVNGLYGVPDGASIAELWRACQSADHWLYVVVIT